MAHNTPPPIKNVAGGYTLKCPVCNEEIFVKTGDMASRGDAQIHFLYHLALYQEEALFPGPSGSTS